VAKHNQTTAHYAKLGCTPLSANVGAVMKPNAMNPADIWWGGSKPPTDLSYWWAEVHHTMGACKGDMSA